MASVPSRQFSAIRLDLCAGSCRSGGNYMAIWPWPAPRTSVSPLVYTLEQVRLGAGMWV